MASPPRLKKSSSHQVGWFDASMLYIRVTDCQATPLIPESLIMHFPAPRDVASCVEVNGVRIPPTEEVALVLRCSRSVKHYSSETSSVPDGVADVMYVSTDNVRTSSTLQFRILEQGIRLIISGSLEKIKVPDDATVRPKALWTMVSSCEVGPDGCAFVKGKYEHAGMGAGTAMEMCAVGRVVGEPMILTQIVPLKRRHCGFSSCGTLNAIPQGNRVDTVRADHIMSMASLDYFDEAGDRLPFFDMPRDANSKAVAKTVPGFESKVMLIKFDSSRLYMTETDQEEKWYKRGISAGIKVGLGIGIGMFIGVGIGLGLIIHKVRTTTNSLKRITL